jgi:hypothetical protein
VLFDARHPISEIDLGECRVSVMFTSYRIYHTGYYAFASSAARGSCWRRLTLVARLSSTSKPSEPVLSPRLSKFQSHNNGWGRENMEPLTFSFPSRSHLNSYCDIR